MIDPEATTSPGQLSLAAHRSRVRIAETRAAVARVLDEARVGQQELTHVAEVLVVLADLTRGYVGRLELPG